MKTKSIKNIFVFSARRVLLALLLMFLGVVVLSSCQIEKRQYMKGFFFGKPGTSKVVQNDSNQIAEHFANIADTINVAVVPETHQEKFPAEGHTNESVSAGHLLKEKEQNKIIKSTGPAFSSEYKYFLPRKTSLITIIPAHSGTKKLHPLAILGLSFLGLSIISYLLFAFLWVPVYVFLLCLVFYVLSIVAFIIARKKTMESKDEWSGIVLIKTFLTIELILLSIFLVAFVTVWFLVITI